MIGNHVGAMNREKFDRQISEGEWSAIRAQHYPDVLPEHPPQINRIYPATRPPHPDDTDWSKP